MDLPLSKPFLKLLVAGCCSSGGVERELDEGEVEAEDKSEWEEELKMVIDAEAKRRSLNENRDLLLMELHEGIRGRRRGGRVNGDGGGGGNGHWVSGVLDLDDFAEIEPERGNFFRQLLRVHALHEKIRKKESLGGGTSVEAMLDEASVEVLQCTVKDLCIDMEYVPQSMVS